MMRDTPTATCLEGAMTLPQAVALSAEGVSHIRACPAGSKLCFDLAGVEKADSSALALMLGWRREAQQAAITLSFIHCPADILALAQLCGVAGLLGLAAAP